MGHQRNVTEFILLGLSAIPEVQKILFLMFFIIYVITVVVKLFIVATIVSSQALILLMYFFLASLSFIDTCYSTSVVPKLIADCLYEKKTISFNGCMTQLFAEHFFGGAEIILLTVMAYDRYVAICKSLHYVTIVTQRLCGLLVLLAWVGGFLHAMIQILLVFQLPFCGPNLMDHFVCDFYPLLELACTDTYVYVTGILVMVKSGVICLVNFIMLAASYVIILDFLRFHSVKGRSRALSTCSSHFTVVVLFFVPCIFTYMRPLHILPVDKTVSIFYSFLTPMLNPLIYTLRNSEVKNAIRKLWS
ncbi:LOW QUALITY PROTEIN: olfactory receptor 4C3-like [Vombatus ursinus]|uniref:LOW QUALITY PROTEIN: olfactory receptor 4C3-like n=1 Tax=Vombatus ursinus TaxID=29139 RepID=UPI000FFD3C35|nr:LOW QUALITY PROTEIN: olfactory receptor 4C3-like [Vombatus ursinus]